jgi:hypothetical protein
MCYARCKAADQARGSSADPLTLMHETDITVVFQGAVIPGPQGTAALIRRTRETLPNSRHILSTWAGSNLADVDVDRVVLSKDPGGLPGIKCRDGAGESNNINRQLLSTQRGLSGVATPFAIKIRTDCCLEHTGFLRTFQRFSPVTKAPSRIVVSSLFTIDPAMFEQMPYHISDWFQFGDTTALRTYWSSPFMSTDDATFYERHAHASHSTFMDRRFRSRLAVEQFLAVHYARQCGYEVPRYHNDCREAVLQGHRRFLARHFLVLDPWDLGLCFPKYDWAYRSSFQQLNCLLFIDWYRLYLEEGGTPVEETVLSSALWARRKQKGLARMLGRGMDKAGPLFLTPGLKRMVNRLLTVLAWQSRPTDAPSVVKNTMPWQSSNHEDVLRLSKQKPTGLGSHASLK